jgi:anti-sigma B factor antagonist
MAFRIETKGKYKILRANQELTALSSIEKLTGVLTDLVDGGNKHLVVDLSETVVIDSSVIGAIVSTHHRVSDRGGEVIVLSGQSRVLSALFHTSINRVVKIIEHEKDLG